MTTGTRIFLVVIIGFTTFLAASVGLTAAAIYNGGVISVEVAETEGDAYQIDVPAGLINVLIGMTPDSLVEEALAEIPAEVESYMPVVREAWRELSRAPDFKLVEVIGHDGHVVIEKRKGSLRILVDDGGSHIDIGIPLKTIRKLINKG